MGFCVSYKKAIVATIFLTVIIALPSHVCSSDHAKYKAQARELLEKQDPVAAEKVLSFGINRYPAAIDLVYFRAIVRADYLKNFSGALVDYTKTIKYAGKSFPKAYYRRGDLFANYGQLDYAIKDYSQCLRIFPKYGKVYFKRAKAYVKLGMLRRADQDLKLCVKYSPKYSAAVQRFRKENHLW